MTQGDTTGEEQHHDYTALTALVRETLGLLRARDGDVALNAERLKTVVDTTREIKEQLNLVNGRTRENEKKIVAIESMPSLTREHCDTHREMLIDRIRVLEGKAPAIVQSIVIGLTMGGIVAAVNYALNRLP